MSMTVSLHGNFCIVIGFRDSLDSRCVLKYNLTIIQRFCVTICMCNIWKGVGGKQAFKYVYVKVLVVNKHLNISM